MNTKNICQYISHTYRAIPSNIVYAEKLYISHIYFIMVEDP